MCLQVSCTFFHIMCISSRGDADIGLLDVCEFVLVSLSSF